MANLDSLRTRVQSAEREIKSLSGTRDAELQAVTKLQKQTQQRCEALEGELEDCRGKLADVEAEKRELAELMMSLLEVIDTTTAQKKIGIASLATPVITAPTAGPAKPGEAPEASSGVLEGHPKNVASAKDGTKKGQSSDNAKKKLTSVEPNLGDEEDLEQLDIPSPDNLPKSLEYLRAFLSK